MFFDTSVTIRVRGKEAKEISDFLEKHQDDFNSSSDVYRAAIIKFIRSYKLETIPEQLIDEKIKSTELK